eukprot:jgi/Psemu1/33047/gm1.33047_g
MGLCPCQESPRKCLSVHIASPRVSEESKYHLYCLLVEVSKVKSCKSQLTQILPVDSPGGTLKDGNDRQPQYHNRNKNKNSSGTGCNTPHFQGQDQVDMKGIVIEHSIDHKVLEKYRSGRLKSRSGIGVSTEAKVSDSTKYLLAQNNVKLDPHLLLLDSQVACNVISNCELLKNIRPHPKSKSLLGFGTVWYLEEVIANILSLGLVSDQYRVTLDTTESNLYVCDLKEQHGSTFTITITKDWKKEMQEMMGFPSTKEFLQMLDYNQIPNCDITWRDVQIAEDIFSFSMLDYIAAVLKMSLPDSLKDDKTAMTHAMAHIFEVASGVVEPLGQQDQENFPSCVAKLLFVVKRARSDIQTAVAFLCTWVQQPNVHDGMKLKWVLLPYLQETIALPLVLGWDGTENSYWYVVDTSFAVHSDTQSLIGALVTIGQGAVVLSMPTKQNINTISSIKAEVGCNPININDPTGPVLGENNSHHPLSGQHKFHQAGN